MTAPRVLFFDAYPHLYGGAQRVLHLQARLLRERGADVAIFLPAAGQFADRLRGEGLTTTVVPAPASLRHYGRTTVGHVALGAALALPRYWAKLGLAMRRWRPDVVHANDHRGVLLAGVPARASGARLVWHVHALQPGSRLTMVGVRLADNVLVPGRAVADAMPELDRRSTLRVLPNPAPDLGEPRPLPPERSLLTIARMDPDKGLDVLLEAIADVRRSVPGLRVTVVGGSQLGWEQLPDDLAARARRLGLADVVTFAGESDDVTSFLWAHRVYVQPSRTEILPLAVLEAMAAARPVIATNVGAMADLVIDGLTGELVPPDDPVALASGLRRMLTDDARSEAMASAGWHRARREFSADRFAATLDELYRSLRAGHPRRDRRRLRRGAGEHGPRP